MKTEGLALTEANVDKKYLSKLLGNFYIMNRKIRKKLLRAFIIFFSLFTTVHNIVIHRVCILLHAILPYSHGVKRGHMEP